MILLDAGRAKVLGLSREVQAASYPGEVGKLLRLDSGWTGALANQPPQLTEGLEATLE